MNATKLKRLRAAGWKVGSTKDFLKLSDEEAALVELKLSLAGALKQARQKRRLSQMDLAQRMGSSQSRVAKIEAGDPSVTIDLMVRAILATGATRRAQWPMSSAPPPSTSSETPVMKLASSEARNSAAFATSHAVPILRRSGTRASSRLVHLRISCEGASAWRSTAARFDRLATANPKKLVAQAEELERLLKTVT